MPRAHLEQRPIAEVVGTLRIVARAPVVAVGE